MISMISHSLSVAGSQRAAWPFWLLQINILFLSSIAITLQLITPQIIFQSKYSVLFTILKRKQTNRQ